MVGLEISEGAIVQYPQGQPTRVCRPDRALQAGLDAGTVIASDETGMRVGKKNRWLWVFHHGLTAVFLGNQSRAKVVVDEFLGEWRPDYWVSTATVASLAGRSKTTNTAWPHLIRDVQYAIDKGDAILAPKLRRLLADRLRHRSQARETERRDAVCL